MHRAFARRTVITHRALICALLWVVIPTNTVASADNVAVSAPRNTTVTTLPNARLIIKDGLFGRASVVVLKGGTLTLKNADNSAYRIKIGATVVVVPAKGSKTIPLPQRGIFSITCAKAPSLQATLTVK